MMVTIQKHKVVNIPSENTLYSWKAIKRTIKKPTQPIPKQTSLPKHRLEFPRFVITPCSPEPLLTLGKILVGISQPQSLPCIQAQEFGLGLMKRRREILPHWRERSKSVLPQVHSPGDGAATYMSHQSWWLQIYSHGAGEVHLQSNSPPCCAWSPATPFQCWGQAGPSVWGSAEAHLTCMLVTLRGCRSGCQLQAPFLLCDFFLYSANHFLNLNMTKHFLSREITKQAGFLLPDV